MHIATITGNPDDTNRKGDEFVRPSVVIGTDGERLPRITDGDAVIFYNFRGDRPRELTKAFCLDEFPFEAEGKDGGKRDRWVLNGICKPDVKFVTMTEYEQGMPVEAAIKKTTQNAEYARCLCKPCRSNTIPMCRD